MKTEYAVNSFTDPMAVYTVTENASPGRPWMCDCKGWIFARTDPATGFKKNCKHIRSVLAAHPANVVASKRTTYSPTPTKPKPQAVPAETVVTVDGEKYKVRRPEAKLV